MGFLERAIRRGVSQGVGNAIGRAVQQAVEPKATELASKAAEQIDAAAQSSTQHAQQTAQAASGLEGVFGNLQRSVEGYATQAAKNMKVCPGCGEATSADKKFCPKCGTQLPEQTIAQGAVCPSCGKQNTVGTKFCSDCGAKLPAAIQEEQAAQAKWDMLAEEWNEKLPGFPAWNLGGKDPVIEVDGDIRWFAVTLENGYMAKQAVEQYRQLLIQSGFQSAGEYPSQYQLYKMAGNTCCHANFENCFEGDEDTPTIYFDYREPSGGFYYVKPEKKAAGSIFDLFR